MAGSWLHFGQKGNGKSVLAVKRIQEYLMSNRPVATNLHLNLQYLLPHHVKESRCYRLPDYPTAADLWALGVGNKTMGDVVIDKAGNYHYSNPIYDEEQNGLLVFDEVSSFLNSREWKGNGRAELLHYLIHTRKMGWDTLYISQHITQVDAQLRSSHIENTVQCIKSTNIHIPYVTKFFRKTGLSRFVPTFYKGYIRLGTSPMAEPYDTFKAIGTRSMFLGYDTRQTFTEGEIINGVMVPGVGLHSVLPPWYTHGRYAFVFPRWLRYSASFLALLGFIYLGFTVNRMVDDYEAKKPVHVVEEDHPKEEVKQALSVLPEPVPITNLFINKDGQSSAVIEGRTVIFKGYQNEKDGSITFFDADDQRYIYKR